LAIRNAPPRLVLASASPRRRTLLAQIGVVPAEIVAPEIDERPRPRELPRDLARRLAIAKAEAGAALCPDTCVLAADTVVACGRRVLPKAEDAAAARRCLSLLSGRRHRVFGGVAVLHADGRVTARVVVTVVTFKRLSEHEIADYLASEEWHGKAGGYAVQGRAAALVRHLNGSYSNVVGLPLFETAALLRGIGCWPGPTDGPILTA